MVKTYRYNRGEGHHLARHLLIILGIPIVVVVFITKLVTSGNNTNHQPVISGGSKSIPQTTAKHDNLQINQPLFTMQLPADWKQTGSEATAVNHSITWQAGIKGADNRYLTIYIDTIPTTKPINLELPVTASGNRLSYGSLSDNCSDFTPGGTMDVGKAEILPPTPSVWQGVNFICNIPQVLLDEVGTGSVGSPDNTVSVTGPKGGTHKYFFLYTDLNIEPDYTILFDAIQSFRAK